MLELFDGRALTRSSIEREAGGSNFGSVKSNTELPTARHRCNIASKEAVLPERSDAEMDLANSLHASAYRASIIKDLIWTCVNGWFYLVLPRTASSECLVFNHYNR